MTIIQKASPYGASHQTPKRIVIHAMSENLSGLHAADFLATQHLSAHVLVDAAGTRFRCRQDTEGAYHALGFNTDSLGIEILVTNASDYASFANIIRHSYITEKQYDALVQQCREWIKLWGITQVDRHSDLSPERKIDPGKGFPWEKFLKDLFDQTPSTDEEEITSDGKEGK